jgi:hypothetical protein
MPNKGDEFQAEAAARNVSRNAELGFGASRLDVSALVTVVNAATISARDKLREIQQSADAISTADMLEMQMMMNQLSHLSALSAAVVGAANTAITAMAKKTRG